MNNLNDKLLAGLGAIMAFMLVWMFYTNSKIDRLLARDASVTKQWRILNKHREHINLLASGHTEVPQLKWSDINLDVDDPH